jgi:hypothetical protein
MILGIEKLIPRNLISESGAWIKSLVHDGNKTINNNEIPNNFICVFSFLLFLLEINV